MTRIASAFASTAFAAAAIGLVLAAPAAADETGPRYVLKDVDGGFIRLDTESGTVSHCRMHDQHWRCELVADAQAALEDEIARLAAENALLQHQLAEAQGQRSTGPSLGLPSEQDFDRIFTFFEGVMRRFMDFARGLNEDSGRES